MNPRIRNFLCLDYPLGLGTVFGFAALCVVLAVLAISSGCRTAGPQVCIRGSHDVTVTLTAETRASMGKSVEGELSPEVSAGVTAQANGNAVSQSGAATASPSGTYDASADASAGDTGGEDKGAEATKAIAEVDSAVLTESSGGEESPLSP